jgi:hypothetical protein
MLAVLSRFCFITNTSPIQDVSFRKNHLRNCTCKNATERSSTAFCGEFTGAASNTAIESQEHPTLRPTIKAETLRRDLTHRAGELVIAESVSILETINHELRHPYCA